MVGPWRNKETAGASHVQGGRREKEARQTKGPSSLAPLGGSFSITAAARGNLPGLPHGVFPAS